MQLFDTHAHLAGSEFSSDLEEVLARSRESGVHGIICVASGDGFTSTTASIALAKSHKNVWATAGVHPLDATTPLNYEKLLKLGLEDCVVAIGETGLDYYYTSETKDLQKEWFKLHIKVALQTGKPLVVHSREAAQDCLKILKDLNADRVGGVFHCYAEDAAFAAELAELNFLVSFTGILTFKKSLSVKEAAKKIPLSQIMLETDAPYLAPVPYRGKRCEPAYIIKTAQALADIKELPLEEVSEITTQTALNFFHLPT